MPEVQHLNMCEMMHLAFPAITVPLHPLHILSDHQEYSYSMNVTCWKKHVCVVKREKEQSIHTTTMSVKIPEVPRAWCSSPIGSERRREVGQGNEKTEEGDEKLDTAACFMHKVIILLNCLSNFGQTERSSDRKLGQRAAQWIAVQSGVCG